MYRILLYCTLCLITVTAFGANSTYRSWNCDDGTSGWSVTEYDDEGNVDCITIKYCDGTRESDCPNGIIQDVDIHGQGPGFISVSFEEDAYYKFVNLQSGTEVYNHPGLVPARQQVNLPTTSLSPGLYGVVASDAQTGGNVIGFNTFAI